MITKHANWDLHSYRNSVHPEVVGIRNIISKNAQCHFILLADGIKHECFRANRICFFNLKTNTKISYVLSFFLKFGLTLILRPSTIVSMGTNSLVPFGISSILTRARFIPIITGGLRYGMSRIPTPLRNVLDFSLKVAFQKAHVILALAESIERELIDNYRVDPEKIFVYKYEIADMFNPNVPKYLKLLLNPTGPIVLAVCRISPEKGLLYLVEASRIIIEKIPNVRIIIVGSSGERASSSEKRYEQKLMTLIRKYDLRERITILRRVPHSEIPKYMSAAAVFVLPSISEGLALVVSEALATGVPVVASKVGGIPDILKDGYNGLIVEPRDTKGLAEAVMKIVSNEKMRRQLIEGGLATIHSLRENEFENLLTQFLSQS